MSNTISTLDVTAPDADIRLLAHGISPRALLIDTRSKPDAQLRMSWRSQYRHDPKRWLDVAWLESMGYQVLVLIADREVSA